MTTAAKPAFYLTRCPRCLAPMTPRQFNQAFTAANGARCGVCANTQTGHGKAGYALRAFNRRLAQGRVVASAPELYEVKKVAEYANMRKNAN